MLRYRLPYTAPVVVNITASIACYSLVIDRAMQRLNNFPINHACAKSGLPDAARSSGKRMINAGDYFVCRGIDDEVLSDIVRDQSFFFQYIFKLLVLGICRFLVGGR